MPPHIAKMVGCVKDDRHSEGNTMKKAIPTLLLILVGCGPDTEPPQQEDIKVPNTEISKEPLTRAEIKQTPQRSEADNNASWIINALAVRLGENEVDHEQLVNTFGPLTPRKVRFLCRWLDKGKAIEMVGITEQETGNGIRTQQMYIVCRYDPKTNLFVQTKTVDGKTQHQIDLTWDRKNSYFEGEHAVPELVGATAKLTFKWTDNKTVESSYKIVKGDKVLLHSVGTGKKTKTIANDLEFDKLKASILQKRVDPSAAVSLIEPDAETATTTVALSDEQVSTLLAQRVGRWEGMGVIKNSDGTVQSEHPITEVSTWLEEGKSIEMRLTEKLPDGDQQLVFTKWYDKEQKRFLLTRRMGGEAASDKPGAYETYDDHSSTYHGVVVEGLSPGMSFTWTSQWLSEDSKWIYTAQLQQDDKVQYTRIDTLQQIK